MRPLTTHGAGGPCTPPNSVPSALIGVPTMISSVVIHIKCVGVYTCMRLYACVGMCK
jgi:hypothetical protein